MKEGLRMKGILGKTLILIKIQILKILKRSPQLKQKYPRNSNTLLNNNKQPNFYLILLDKINKRDKKLIKINLWLVIIHRILIKQQNLLILIIMFKLHIDICLKKRRKRKKEYLFQIRHNKIIILLPYIRERSQVNKMKM